MKATFRIDADLMNQVRAAYWATAYQTGITSPDEWVQEAPQAKLIQEQERYNGVRNSSLSTPVRPPRAGDDGHSAR